MVMGLMHKTRLKTFLAFIEGCIKMGKLRGWHYWI